MAYGYEHKELGVIEEASAAISNAKLIMQFVLGGKAIFTLKNAETGNRFTYRVDEKANPDKSVVYFVSLLAGPDNEADYTYLGWIKNRQFSLTKKSRMNGLTEQTPSVKAFSWAYSNFTVGIVPEKLEFWHAGRCGRCGKKLTVPESIENGFGPECITKVGGFGNGQAPIVGNQQAISTNPISTQQARSVMQQRSQNPNEPSDDDVKRMVAALQKGNPEQFFMDGEVSDQLQAYKFWFKRYKKSPMSASELVELEAQ